MRPCPSWQLTVPIGDDGSSTPIMVAWGDEWGLVSLSDCLSLSELCPACLPSRAGRLTRGGQVLIKTLQGFLMTRKSPIRRPLRRKDITSGTLQETRIAEAREAIAKWEAWVNDKTKDANSAADVDAAAFEPSLQRMIGFLKAAPSCELKCAYVEAMAGDFKRLRSMRERRRGYREKEQSQGRTHGEHQRFAPCVCTNKYRNSCA